MLGDLISHEDLLDNLLEGIYIVDENLRIIYWNSGAEQITGYTKTEVIGTSCRQHVLRYVDRNGDNPCLGQCPLKTVMHDNQGRDRELFLHHKDGHRLPVLLRSMPTHNVRGEITGAIEIFYENYSPVMLTERLRELEKLSFIDALTGMTNRRYIEISLESHLGKMNRYGGSVGLLFIDIDNFKAINDTYGHKVGDRALKLVANNLVHNSRSFDICGRWGGEEFIVICENVQEPDLVTIGERYRMLVESSSLPLDNSTPLKMTISIGATLAVSDTRVETLIQRADELMYQSKQKGKNRVTFGV